MITVARHPYVVSDAQRDGVVRFYVGRGKSAAVETCTLGNPFRGPNRERAIHYYRFWLEHSLQMDEKVQRVFELILNTTRKHDVVLICHCAPMACHADVIKEMIEERLTQNN